jgi:DNA-binding MarR family transcriptional regulator
VPRKVRTSKETNRPGFGKLAGSETAPFLVYRGPGYLARRFQQVCAAIITESLATEGLTQLQWAVIGCVDDWPGIDQRRVADALGIVPFNVGQIVDELQEMGILERRLNGSDRRVRQLVLTARGRKLRSRLQPDNTRANARILSSLAPSERDTLLDLLVRVIKANADYARPGAGRRKRGWRGSPAGAIGKSTSDKG